MNVCHILYKFVILYDLLYYIMLYVILNIKILGTYLHLYSLLDLAEKKITFPWNVMKMREHQSCKLEQWLKTKCPKYSSGNQLTNYIIGFVLIYKSQSSKTLFIVIYFFSSRTCPNCNNKFLKESGCNRMKCICGTCICYICKKEISDCYDHFYHDNPMPNK